MYAGTDKSSNPAVSAPMGPIPAPAAWHMEHLGNRGGLKPNQLNLHSSSWANCGAAWSGTEKHMQEGATEGRAAGFGGSADPCQLSVLIDSEQG